MSEIIQKTKQLITHEPRDEAIKELIKLQRLTSEKERHIPRLACLSLMEMNHDWQGIRKLIVDWRLIAKFGSNLVKRMRKRVNEEDGVVSEEQETILSELDRLNDKNWRQFSPKRNFPDYSDLVTEEQKREIKPQVQNEDKPENKERTSSLLDSNRLSKVLQTKMVEKPAKESKEKEIMTRGVFSKQFVTRSENTADRNEAKNERSLNLMNPSRDSINPEAMRKNENSNSNSNSNSHSNSNSILKRSENPIQRLITPSKEAPKKVISLKYENNERDRIKEESFKEEFSFSAVKAKQVQAYSNKKIDNANRNDDLNDSFSAFANESKQPKDYHKKIEQKNNFNDEFSLEKELAQTNYRSKPIKKFLSEQELALIEPEIPVKNYIQNIMIAENKTGISMLKNRLGIK